MEITRRNIQRNYKRNKDIVALGGTNSKGGGSAELPPLNFLPADRNADGTYTVPLDKVVFSGSVIAQKEVAAYGIGSGDTSGGTAITIYDGLDSTDPKVALSANQGRILDEKIKTLSATTSGMTEEKLKEYYKKNEVDKLIKEHKHDISGVTGLQEKITIYDEKIKNFDPNKYLLKEIWDKAFYFEGDDLHAKIDVIGDAEVSAWGKGQSAGGGGLISIADNLTTNASNIALSAKQGVVLKEMIDNFDTSKLDLDQYLLKSDARLMYAPKIHKHSIADITDLQTYINKYDKHLTDSNTHINDKVIHITKEEREKWNDANTKKHEHTNKAVLDKITQTNYDNWNTVVNNWNKAFYFEGNDIHVKINLIGDKEVSAWGKGDSASTGVITIVDSLNSYSKDAALSANQGRILNNKFTNYPTKDNFKTINGENIIGTGDIKISAGTQVNLDNYYNKTQVNNLLANKSDTGHTHSQYLTSSSLNGYVTTSTYNAGMATKSNTGHTHSQYLTSSALNGYATQSWVTGTCWTTSDFNISNYVTKSTYNAGMATKSNTGHTHDSVEDYYNGLTTKLAYSKDAIALPTYMAGWNGYELRAVNSSQFWTTADFTSTSVSHWNTAYNNSHSHSNKGTLDGISSSNVANWNGKVSRSGDTMSGTLTVNNNIKTSGDLIFTNTSSIKVNNTEHMMFSSNDVTCYTSLDGDGYWHISDVGEAYFNGNILSDGEVTAYSDKRLKDNIKPLKNRGFVQPVTYTKNGKESIGFIAQDVQKLYKELVIEDKSENHYLSVNYQQFTAVLEAQIIAQQHQIDELTKQITDIKKYINYDIK